MEIIKTNLSEIFLSVIKDYYPKGNYAQNLVKFRSKYVIYVAISLEWIGKRSNPCMIVV